MKRIVILFCLSVFVACKTQAPIIPVALVAVKNIQQSGLEEFFEFSHYIVLSTPDTLPIGSVNKLQIKNGNLFLTDRKTQQAFVFDSEGNMRTILNHTGRAGNEYIELTDLETGQRDGKDILCVYDGKAGKILHYSIDGKICLSTEPATPGIAFKFVNDHIAINNGNGWAKDNYVYHLYDKGESIYEAIPFDQALRGYLFSGEEGKSVFYEYGGISYMSTYSDDIVYKIDPGNGEIHPLIKFDFGKKFRPKSYSRNFIDAMMHGDIPSFPNCFYDFGDSYLIRYSYANKPYVTIVSTTGQVIYNGVLGKDKNGLPFLPIPYYDSDSSGFLISMLRSDYLETFLKLNKSKNADTTLIEEIMGRTDDGIILMFYKPVIRSSKSTTP